MQILFLLPLMAVSLVVGLLCLAVPRWRRYFSGAVVTPIAFGGCGIVGMFVTILGAESLGVNGAMGFDQPWDPSKWGTTVMFAIIFVLPGAIGAYVAARVAGGAQRWWSVHRLRW